MAYLDLGTNDRPEQSYDPKIFARDLIIHGVKS